MVSLFSSRSGCSVGTCLGRSYRPRASVQQEPSAHAAQDDHKPAETRPACHRAGGSSKQVVVEVSMGANGAGKKY